jgi:23S rRNA (uridine2552-2'-O)-methyltransferase
MAPWHRAGFLMRPLSTSWRGKQHLDPSFRQAKARGYLARSALKLIEIDRSQRLLAPGAAVVDLGCFPGSWSQVCAERVLRSGGVVIGVDSEPEPEADRE